MTINIIENIEKLQNDNDEHIANILAGVREKINLKLEEVKRQISEHTKRRDKAQNSIINSPS